MDDIQRRRDIVKRLRPIDDTFFEVLMQDIDTCQELLRVVLEDDNLIVEELHPQESIKNLQGRSVRLDAFCTLSSGKRCNIEVQKGNNDNHLKRVRYNASCITANVTEPGTDFEDIPDVYVVYISTFDIFKHGKTIYHVEKTITETGGIVSDGLHEIFVNTKIDDGSTIAEYMQCMIQENVDNRKFPYLTKRCKQFKGKEGGADNMCKLVEDYAKDYAKEHAKEYAKEYAEEQIKESQKETARLMFAKGVAIDIIKLATSALSDEELEAIANEMIRM